MLELTVSRLDTAAYIAPTDDQLESWVATVLAKLGIAQAALSIRITDGEEIRGLNHQYRQRDKATNVLSFPMDDDVPDAEHYLGDIVIAGDVVISEANNQAKLANEHWCHLVCHGVLHLLGYDHVDNQDAEEMEGLERQVLASLGIADPYLTTGGADISEVTQ